MSPNDLFAIIWHFTWPPIDARQRHTFSSAQFLIIAVLPLFVSVYIRLRHPKTPLLVKIALFLISAPITSHTFGYRYFAHVWYTSDGIPLSITHLNFLIGMANQFTICKLIEIIFLASENELKVKGSEAYVKHLGKRKELTAKEKETIERPHIFPGSFAPLEIDIAMGVRGLGYNWGPKNTKAGYEAFIEAEQLSKKPTHVAVERKRKVLKRIGSSAIISWFVVDVCDSFLKNPNVFPAALNAGGGSVEEARGGVFGPAGPFIVTFLTGLIGFSALQGIVATLYFVNMALTKPVDSPITESRWEPLPFDYPHLATSISSFWSVHWHSFIRRVFMVCAYRPAMRISENLGLPKKIGQILAIVATFTLSGLLHEGCIQGQANTYYDIDLHKQYGHTYIANSSPQEQAKYGMYAKSFLTTYAFAIQAVFVLFEQFWIDQLETHVAHFVGIQTSQKRAQLITGRSRSIIGWIWTMSCVMYSGYYLSDLWLYHGLINSAASARLTSPFVNVLMNLIKK